MSESDSAIKVTISQTHAPTGKLRLKKTTRRTYQIPGVPDVASAPQDDEPIASSACPGVTPSAPSRLDDDAYHPPERSRSGRVIRAPQRYEPIEVCHDDYSDDDDE